MKRWYNFVRSFRFWRVIGLCSYTYDLQWKEHDIGVQKRQFSLFYFSLDPNFSLKQQINSTFLSIRESLIREKFYFGRFPKVYARIFRLAKVSAPKVYGGYLVTAYQAFLSSPQSMKDSTEITEARSRAASFPKTRLRLATCLYVRRYVYFLFGIPIISLSSWNIAAENKGEGTRFLVITKLWSYHLNVF